jgi:uncharacterized protein (TIGR03118 family)
VLSLLCLLPTVALAQHYTQTNLVANTGDAPVNDANLQNAWGLVHGANTPWWVSNNASGTSSLYDATGVPPGPVTIPPMLPFVTIPPGSGTTGPGKPTAVMFNGSATDFLLAPMKPAVFIWATEDGTIAGWNPGVNPTTAVTKVDLSDPKKNNPTAVYKGATIAEMNGREYILAANFRSGRIDVFDTNFNKVHISEELFDDDSLPRGYAPFNVQNIGRNIYVAYAKQDDMKEDDDPGPGRGFVDVFNRNGRLIQRLQHGPWLNAPWGITLAPAFFGEFSHAILVGQFGDGTIAAFNPVTGRFIGNMLNPDGSIVKIGGLWGLAFGNGGKSGPGNSLFFTAGPADEMNGLFGTLTPIATELNEDDEQ